MKDPTHITVEILKDIRQDLRDVRQELRDQRQESKERFEKTDARIDGVEARFEERFDTLGRRIVESEVRTATAITDLAASVHELSTILRAERDLRPRVEKCEQDIADLRRRLPQAS